jgi:hypothetical protein
MSERTTCLAFSLALYVLALALPAVNGHYGVECLIGGWFGLGSGVGIGWLANFAMFGAWIGYAVKSKGTTLAFSGIAALLMLSTLANPYMVDSTGGYKVPINDFGLGFIVWIGSAIAAALSALMDEKPAKNGRWDR